MLIDAGKCGDNAAPFDSLVCADGDVTGYVPFAYDAVVALAHGIHGVVETAHEANKDPVWADVYASMRNASFEGALSKISSMLMSPLFPQCVT